MPGVPVVGPLMAKLFGTRNERLVKKYLGRVEEINALEPELRKLSDAELRAKTSEFQERYRNGESENDLIVEVFAVAREVMDRAVGIRNIFDPTLEFDPSILPDDARRLYDETKAKIAETPDAEPAGELIGNTELVPAWKLVDIPTRLHDAIRELYPESKPPFRSRPFDVQLVGGIVLADHKYDRVRSAAQARNVYFGAIAEMKTGEGKTIVAPLASYLHAIANRQIHVVTVNSYLVRRDRYWTFPFFYHLGLTVGYIAPMHEMPEPFKKAAYRCHVVYGTTSEFGFDYLRDNMKLRVEDQVQKRRDFAIVDEVDSTLIDEARTPLIISGPAHEEAPRYHVADKLARHLVEKQRPWNEANKRVETAKMRIKGIEGDIRNARDKSKVPQLREELERLQNELPQLEDARDRHIKYYDLEMDKKQVHLEHEGVTEAQKVADIGSFYVGDNIDMPHLLEQALRGHTVYERDRDYVVKDGQVVIVDQFTGRLMVGRQWSDGLHQAVEAKEGVEIKPETQTMATITIQNFFKLYERLSGMTGTADTEAQEFHDIYHMDVVVIPTNLPVIRNDFNDRVYLSEKDKWNAIVEEIKNFHDLGRPVLVGTTSVEKSEMLSQRLTKKYGIQHEVLNAKQHEREAHMIESAGVLGAVMIATNMAGRGTDIKLRSVNREDLINHWKRRALCPRQVEPSMSDEEIIQAIYRYLAEKRLGMKKAEVEALSDEEVQRRLLSAWALEYTYLEQKAIDKMSNDELREELDEGGNFLLHRLEMWKSTEALGGLHVIGTERHESRRIDNQLRGRSGRQGDNGSTRFFISLEDDLMQMFAGETTMRVLSRLGMKEGDAIEHPMLTRAVERAQRKVEERNFEIRKNILEYDEVMDHQRLSFYGRRQRILEGRGLREIVLEYIEEAIDDAVDRFMAPDFVSSCIGEWVQTNLDVSIEPDRLRMKDRDDLFERIRRDANADQLQAIGVTIGEFMNDDTDPIDWDVKGLVSWARSRYGVELRASEVREMNSAQVTEIIAEAARERTSAVDLTPLDQYLADHYGAQELVDWANGKFLLNLDLEDIVKFETNDEVREFLFDKAREAYLDREVRYPVDYAIDMTMAIMAQDPQAALDQLAQFARRKYGLDWDASYLRINTPQQYREELLDESRKWATGRVDEVVDEALRDYPDDESLDAWLQERFGMRLRDLDRNREGDERRQMLHHRVEQFSRSELNQFERFVLLQILDQSWKDHLYFMDQLRSSVSFRAFAQQDPRIEYRREGRRLFDRMHETIRDKVTDLIFKAKLTPSYQPRSVYRSAREVAPPPQDTGVHAPTAAGGAGAAAATASADASPAGARQPEPSAPSAPEPEPVGAGARASGSSSSSRSESRSKPKGSKRTQSPKKGKRNKKSR